jgi:hypothetical protein
MRESLDWDAIMGLSEQALHLAIEKHCYGRKFRLVETIVAQGQRIHIRDISPTRPGFWLLSHHDANAMPEKEVYPLTTGHIAPYAYTASWERTMALAWEAHICLMVCKNGHALVMPTGNPLLRVECRTPAETRRAICRLALYRAVQHRQEAPDA